MMNDDSDDTDVTDDDSTYDASVISSIRRGDASITDAEEVLVDNARRYDNNEYIRRAVRDMRSMCTRIGIVYAIMSVLNSIIASAVVILAAATAINNIINSSNSYSTLSLSFCTLVVKGLEEVLSMRRRCIEYKNSMSKLTKNIEVLTILNIAPIREGEVIAVNNKFNSVITKTSNILTSYPILSRGLRMLPHEYNDIKMGNKC